MTDERDPKLDAAYRALGPEEPPVAIDQAILAASRRAVQAHPAPLVAPTGRRAWFVPLAAAAVLALAVGVTLHMQLEQPGIDGLPTVSERDRPEAVAKSGQPAAKEPVAAPQSPARAAAADSVKAEKPAIAAFAPPAATGEMRAQPAPKTEVASTAKEKAADTAEAGPRARLEREQRAPEEIAKRDSERSFAQARVPAPAAAPPAPQAGASSSLAKRADATSQAAADTPERELELIANLRKQGRHDEADKEFAEFRKRHPDYKLTEAMRERVERR